jgi:hypothetical protein
MTDFTFVSANLQLWPLIETVKEAVIPDLVGERSEAESVGNPCLYVEGARTLSGTDIRRNVART